MRPEYLRLLGHLRMREVDRSAAKAWPSRSVPAGGNNVLGDGMMEGWKGFGSVTLPVPVGGHGLGMYLMQKTELLRNVWSMKKGRH